MKSGMKPDLPQDADILIIGAGIAGLMAANVLKKNGRETLLLDKGRSVGGRLATRRIGPGRADHGAQFFTVRTPDFEIWVEQWRRTGLVYRWATGWSDGSLSAANPDGYPRYAVNGGMNTLAQHLAGGLNVRLNAQITAIQPTAAGWLATAESGETYASRAIILTPPVPQSLAMLNQGQTPLAELDQTGLMRISYAPCITGLFWVEGPVNLPEPGAVQRPQEPISWIANNQRKGISPEATLLTVQAGPEYSRQLWDLPPNEALQAITAGLSPFLTASTQIVEAQLKQWRYALPVTLHPDRCLAAANLPPLVFAGDAFGEPRIEGAALSGMAAANKLLGLVYNNQRGNGFAFTPG